MGSSGLWDHGDEVILRNPMKEPAPFRHWRFAALIAAAVSLCAAPSGAIAAELGASDYARLAKGQPVVHEDVLETSRGRYIGGVSYQLIDAPASAVLRVVEDVRSYRYILPYTRSARWIGISRGGDSLVELEQGNSLASGRYTLRFRREPGSGDSGLYRFWVDRRLPHDIVDAGGFLRVEAAGESKTLVTYMVLVDLGGGLLPRLFERRIQAAALRTPALLKHFVERHPS